MAALVVGVAALGALAYGELVLDFQTPRSTLAHSYIFGFTRAARGLFEAQEAMRRRYGATAQTTLRTPGFELVTQVDGKVVARGTLHSEFGDVSGLFVIGPRGRLRSTFPFHIDPRTVPGEGQQDHATTTEALKNTYGHEFPAKYFAFEDRDSSRETCIPLSWSNLAELGMWLRVQYGTFCVVRWRGADPSAMLIGVTVARGDPWMRPFTRRICRALTTVALARLAARDHGPPPPNYAGCILVDRPDRSGETSASDVLQAYVYEVRGDATLAVIN
jgi:hypothetical protein